MKGTRTALRNPDENMSIYSKTCKLISTKLGLRYKLNQNMRNKLSDYQFSVFSNNCIGGVFLHDAGKRFNSPTVNLRMGGLTLFRF